MPLRTDRAPLNLRVNGKGYQLVVKPWHTLLEVLRDDLGLTGTKRGCEDGTCGTCTVTGMKAPKYVAGPWTSVTAAARPRTGLLRS